jgi:hypothetical protein
MPENSTLLWTRSNAKYLTTIYTIMKVKYLFKGNVSIIQALAFIRRCENRPFYGNSRTTSCNAMARTEIVNFNIYVLICLVLSIDITDIFFKN